MLPSSMQCITFTPGTADQLRLETRTLPTPTPTQVLIRVRAAGINRPDVLQRKGLYLAPSDASDLLGLEVAGEVVQIGAQAGRWQIGDAVCALVHGGGYAEYCVAEAEQCLPIPASFSWVEAAALPETFFTVWSNVFQRGALQAGESLLVHGGAGGIGTTAVMLAHALGHRVFATAGSAEKCQLCMQLGASVAINYREEDFVTQVREVTRGRGVDVILDIMGGDYTPRNLKALADDGRLVLIAFLGGAKSAINVADVLLRRLTITGSTLRPRSPAIKAHIARELEAQVWPLFARGAIRPLIHTTFPLAQACAAHQLMESGEHAGKIVLQVQD